MLHRSSNYHDSRRVLIEDALKHLLDCDEAGRGATLESLAGAMGKSRDTVGGIFGDLRGRGLAVASGDSHHLTADGRAYALQVVRKHRLYETWLAEETSTPAGDWHRRAHKAEHHLEAEEVNQLADRLNNPRYDPHGDPIPTREGHMPQRSLTSLASWQDGETALIEHIEDEPTSLYRQAEVLALGPGTCIIAPRHLEDGSIEATVENRTIRIAAALATLVHVTTPAPDEVPPSDMRRLSSLETGGEATVYRLAASCTGAERRRLLDLGVVPGTRVRCEFASPFGSPRSYLIRGALIALRDHQADRILIHTLPHPES